MENEGRPVKFQYNDYNEGWLEDYGTFIKWGSGLNDKLGTPIQITFAVVEGRNGQVYRVEEHNIKFTDKGN